MPGHPNIVRARGARNRFRGIRLVNNDNLGGRRIVVERKAEVKADADAAVSKRRQGHAGEKSGAEETF
jgi:hypothetical protein